MKKLRLLFTNICNRNCKGCCNKDWNLYSLEKVSHFNYDEILITGGEPLQFPDKLLGFLQALKIVTKAKIYIYTAKIDDPLLITLLLQFVDGLTVTLHTQKDVKYYNNLINYWKDTNKYLKDKSLRLNVFKGINYTKDTNWQIKDNITWKKNCPLPKDEEFKRL